MTGPWLLFWTVSFMSLSVATAAKEVTNQDIRDAILSLVHLARDSQDKLERHEYRERQLGETLKRSLLGLEKKHRNLEPLKGILGRLDERLASVETILIQKDERERIQMQKTQNAIDNIQNSLGTWMKTIESRLKDPPKVEVPQNTNSVSKDDLVHLQNNISPKVDIVLQKVGQLDDRIDKIQNESNEIKQLNEKSVKKLDQVEGHIRNNEQLLSKYENRLAELNNYVQPLDTRFGAAKDETDWKANFLTALQAQHSNLDQIQQDIKAVTTKIYQLPELKDILNNHNNTLETLQEMKYELSAKTDKDVAKVDMKLKTLEDKLEQDHEELVKSISDIGEMSENVYTDVTKSYEILSGEVQALSKVEKVMLQTADNVLDTKRRIEYGVHQILLEVGDLVKINSKELNATLNNRFDNIELTILDNQTGALANLSQKLEQEMSQVWRQIGIMYQELTVSTSALDKLQEQTEMYVNGSVFTMNNIKSKVGQITTSMTDVDDNLNYLIGRLSLVVQEFNLLKTGLGDALEKIKETFKSVQDKVKDEGPGPHNIKDDVLEQ